MPERCLGQGHLSTRDEAGVLEYIQLPLHEFVLMKMDIRPKDSAGPMGKIAYARKRSGTERQTSACPWLIF